MATTTQPYPQRFGRSPFGIVFDVVALNLVIAGFWWCVSVERVVLAIGLTLLFVFLSRDMLKSVTSVTIWQDRLEVHFPFRTSVIRPREIKGILLFETRPSGLQVPKLSLQLASGVEIKLRAFGTGNLALYRQLSALVSQRQ